jgi:hypothetical protein
VLNLNALANWESAVLASIRGAAGTIEERDAQITRSGMYAEYPAILDSYLELIDSQAPDEIRLEALKRTTFLVWYSFYAPSTETGMSEIPESIARRVMQLLDSTLTAERGDDELRAMLAWYRDTFGEPFEFFGPVRSLDPFIRDMTTDDARGALAASDFAGRGQLGLYWAQILNR